MVNQNFFINARDQLNSEPLDIKPSDANDFLESELKIAKDTTFEALCDSFNTPAAMTVISDLISKYHSADKTKLSAQTLREVGSWITSMVNTFGLNGSTAPNGADIGWSGIDIPKAAEKYLRPLSSLRDELRSLALSSKEVGASQVQEILKQPGFAIVDDGPDVEGEPFNAVLQSFRGKVTGLGDSNSLAKEILQLCDTVRDIDLWNLGIYLEDREGLPALIRRVTRDLMAARQEKVEREQQKQKAKEDRDREAAKRADKGRMSHLEMFRTNEYTSWDHEGLPIKDAEGEEITKSKAKKLRKDWEKQKKLHEAWLKTVEGSVQ